MRICFPELFESRKTWQIKFFDFSEKRLVRVLLLFGQITKESKPENPLKVSQATLAEMVGTTRARVSKFMHAFKKKGFVYYNGGLQINNGLIRAFLQNRPMSVVRRAKNRLDGIPATGLVDHGTWGLR